MFYWCVIFLMWVGRFVRGDSHNLSSFYGILNLSRIKALGLIFGWRSLLWTSYFGCELIRYAYPSWIKSHRKASEIDAM
ncbi:hypothetical protein PCAR4_40108 [Paraburkholderia caribensis]|nr:hypothetical protein PCAR4_40108 [Paraburkholderia caribensis]